MSTSIAVFSDCMKKALLLLLLFAAPISAQTIPPAPATCTAAVEQSNLFAYNGNHKNTPDYWCPMYDKDRDYFWKRMLGWQAEGGPDQALSGLYAVPPSPWFGQIVMPPAPVPQPPPAPIPSVDLTPVLNQLAQCIAEVQNLGVQVQDVNHQVQEGRKENQAFQEGVKSTYERIVGSTLFKVAISVGGGLLAGMGIAK